MDWLTILSLVNASAEIKKWIDIGLPVYTELQKKQPNLIPVIQKIGKDNFPELTTVIDMVAAGAEWLFDPHGNMWVQESLNELDNAGLEVDGLIGPRSRQAIKAFQAKHPPLDVDGWAGEQTCAVIATEKAKNVL